MGKRYRSKSPKRSKSEKDHHSHHHKSSPVECDKYNDGQERQKDRDRDRDKSRERRKLHDDYSSEKKYDVKHEGSTRSHGEEKYYSKRGTGYMEGDKMRYKDDDYKRRENRYERDHHRTSRSSRSYDRDERRSSHRKEERRKDGWSYFGYTEKDLDTGNTGKSDKQQSDLKPERNDSERGSRQREEPRGRDVEGRLGPGPSSSGESKTIRDDADENEDKKTGLFDWQYHRSELDRLFFKDDDAVIKK